MIVENERGVRLLRLIKTDDKNVPWSSYTPLAASVVLAAKGAEFLLVWDNSKRHWELPGGAIEPGESAGECALRELQGHSPMMLNGIG